MSGSFHFVIPEALLTLAAVVLLLLENGNDDRRRTAVGVTVASLVLAGGVAAFTVDGSFFGVLTSDALGRYFKVLISGLLVATAGFFGSFKGFRGTKDRPFEWGTFCAVFLLGAVGLNWLVSASNYLMMLVAIELVSIPSFIMTGFGRRDRRSSEAAVKYFLVGAMSTGFMVYGFSLLYGLTGSTSLAALSVSQGSPALLGGGLFFVLAGLGFKLALAPFHMWAPDVYEGAPTPVTAFLSVAPKAAAVALMARFCQAVGPMGSGVLALVAALTMTVGNVGALRQTNVKRLFAYSSIAQMGYVAMGLSVGGATGIQSVLVYVSVYVVMNLGAFAAILALTEESGSDTLDAFSGLAVRSLPAALITTVFLLSLTGIPPLAGFVGKFSLFSAVMSTPGRVWLAVVGGLNSVVSLAYYFSIVRRMFFDAPSTTSKVRVSAPLWATLSVTGAFTLAAGVFPQRLLDMARCLWR